jgi:hypothetical protein
VKNIKELKTSKNAKQQSRAIWFRAREPQETQKPESTIVWKHYVVRDAPEDDSDPLNKVKALFDSYQI